MSNLEARLEVVKTVAEERSNLQRLCFDKLDLTNVKKPVDISKARFEYDNCIKDNKSNYAGYVSRELALNPAKY